MSYSKFLLYMAVILLSPYVSLAVNLNENIYKGFYAGIQYKPAKYHLSYLDLKEDGYNTIDAFALKKFSEIKKNIQIDNTTLAATLVSANNFTIGYNPHYKNSYLGISGALGYYYHNGFRVESEISSERFLLKNEGYKILDHEKYFVLARSASGNGRITRVFSPNENEYVILMNDGIRSTSLIFNACYDTNINIHGLITYSCVGFGADLVDFLGKYSLKPSYQTKLGISYPVSSNIIAIAEGYYHGLLSRRFDKIPVNSYAIQSPLNSVDTTASALLNIRYYGGSIGVRFILGSL
ncbi:Map1-related protein [Ehrlichia ruminantium]|uniref:MAP1-13 n=2 Tax=Ehrlichia ruminantium TaxID=779 RepID=Q6VCZ0_EHRRU|nr:P44/Msp2 family outer membrane protein [Ehrlichia ruminantium]AAR10931.1 MAP1-13 [Ehrlichia ruminantium]QLK52787.1 P44/Msp2 family outer membrane protein [Ehrlichia ruminantium]QLK54621.1 P44/Msp2 family outer membrane protein [Ehrlichia ruminantium]QLK55546.1 P44/Msp2 family outer membrane protein [Ehrlichia ruminantium]QLK56462.1 P44/Msp2 family outer membrane protein [Ehrlichia ruminantium]